jgi:isopropylmalate/homocitrate/citramalate synthase
MKLDDLGMPTLPSEQMNAVLTKIKELSLMKKGLVNDTEFTAIVKEVTG